MPPETTLIDTGIAELPDQFVPPVLDFDALDLYPSEEFVRASKEYQDYLIDRQASLAQSRAMNMPSREKPKPELSGRSDASEADAERHSLDEQTRRANELQSEELKAQALQFAQALQRNTELQTGLATAQAALGQAQQHLRNAQSTAKNSLKQLFRKVMAVSTCLLVGSG